MQCDFKDSIDCLARNGVGMTAVWHEKLDKTGVRQAGRILEDAEVRPVALCIGGMLTSGDSKTRRSSLDLTRRRMEEASRIGAKSLVILTGGLDGPGQGLFRARQNALEAMTCLLDDARLSGVRLLLEPLHPMVCGFRSVISSLRAANDMLDELDAEDVFGLVVDTYALWWDLDLQSEILRSGQRIGGLHVSDWLRETTDVRLDSGMPGDGLIDNSSIRSWVESAGYHGPVEVEIFSARNWWRQAPDAVISEIISRAGKWL